MRECPTNGLDIFLMGRMMLISLYGQKTRFKIKRNFNFIKMQSKKFDFAARSFDFAAQFNENCAI